MDYPKSIPNVGLVGGKFIDENISTGLPGSLIPSAWGNAVTDELLAVIRAAGLVPSEDNKTQLLQAIQGIAASDLKQSVRVATTGPIALSGLQTIDGLALAAGYRVLVKDQANASQNGIYVASAGAWGRALDANDNADFTPGFIVVVQAGAQHGGSVWQLKNQMVPTVGTTDLTFGLVFGKTGVTAGDYRKVSVDPQGRVTGGSNPTTLAGYGIVDAAPLASPSFTGSPTAPSPAPLDASQRVSTTGFVYASQHGLIGVDVAGAGEFVLTDDQAGKGIIYLSGALTGDRTIILPRTARRYMIRNATSYPFKLFVRMSVGAAVEIAQGKISNVFTDNANTFLAQTDFPSPALTGTPTAPTAAVGTNTDQIATSKLLRDTMNAYGLGSTNAGEVSAANQLPALASGNYYYTNDFSPYGAYAFVQRMTYAGNRGFEIANIPYTDRFFGRASNADGSWRAPIELASTAALANKADKSNTLAGYGILAATQQEAEQGSDTTKPMTALRVWQAIAAKVVAATEFVAGITRFASLAEVKAGASGYLAVCPYYLVDGFGYNFGINGYLKLPSWMGGLIIQWAYSDESAGSGDFRYFPVPFTQAVYGSWLQLSVETSTGFAGNFGTILSVPDLTRYQWTAAGTWGGGGKGWILALGK
ncbi:MAG: hypothetical protein H5U33_15840 [Pseudomonas sp.]|nr:hypothetical protein [Pseudomonas sp.]